MDAVLLLNQEERKSRPVARGLLRQQALEGPRWPSKRPEVGQGTDPARGAAETAQKTVPGPGGWARAALLLQPKGTF